MCMHLLEERGSDRTPKCPNDQYASLNLKFYEIKKLDRLFDSKTYPISNRSRSVPIEPTYKSNIYQTHQKTTAIISYKNYLTESTNLTHK